MKNISYFQNFFTKILGYISQIAYLYYIKKVNHLNQSVMSYASVNYESFGNIKNIPANKARVIKAGLPVVTYTNMFGKSFYLPYRTKKQYAEIVQFIKLFRNEDITLKRILSDYSVKMGRYVNESKLRKEIKAEFGFTKSAIDLILSIH